MTYVPCPRELSVNMRCGNQELWHRYFGEGVAALWA